MRPALFAPKNILNSLTYNEEKLNTGVAERIRAENFLKDHDRLSKREIVDRFRQRTSMNEGLGDQGFHFSLNFGKREVLSNEKMAELTGRFMDDMGWGDQPYVAYRHEDAGHTHLHIVATAARVDGSLIYLRPWDFQKAHSLCRSMEKEYKLEEYVRARQEQQEEFAVEHAQ